MKNYYRGLFAEYLSIGWLYLKGYRILAHRYRTPVGEIDLVAQRGKVIAFIEVKYRSQLHEALEAITEHQQYRLRRAASLFLASYDQKLTKFFQKGSGFDMRFDILLVVKYKLLHLKNYWGHHS